MNEDIKFSNGKTYVLLIDTNLYSGNFEREMASFVAGAYDEDRWHGADGFEEFKQDAEESDILTNIMEKVTAVTHEEYGDVTNTIWTTPGRSNDGVGRCYDSIPGEQAYPAYETVAVFFDGPLSPEEMTVIKDRAESFASLYDKTSIEPLRIKAVRQIVVETKITAAQWSEVVDE